MQLTHRGQFHMKILGRKPQSLLGSKDIHIYSDKNSCDSWVQRPFTHFYVRYFFFSLVRDLYIAEMEGILGISKPWSLNRWGFRYLDSWKVLFCLKGYERWGQCYEPDLSCLKLRWGSFKDNLGTQWTVCFYL